jgi:hypothetical protein
MLFADTTDDDTTDIVAHLADDLDVSPCVAASVLDSLWDDEDWA